MLKEFYIEWTAIYEGFTYSETVTDQELSERFADKTIQVTYIETL